MYTIFNKTENIPVSNNFNVRLKMIKENKNGLSYVESDEKLHSNSILVFIGYDQKQPIVVYRR